MIYLCIFLRDVSQAQEQSYGYTASSESTLQDMGKSSNCVFHDQVFTV